MIWMMSEKLHGGEVFHMIWDDVGQLLGGDVFYMILMTSDNCMMGKYFIYCSTKV